MRRRAAASTLVIAVLVLACAATTADARQKFRRAAGFGPPPAYGDCLVLPSTHGCIYDVRLTEFALSSHVVHVGGTLTATASSQWKEQTPGLSGPGLRLTHRSVVPQKSFTASFKAVAATGPHWQVGPGITISVPGSAVYTESDYYAVVDKRAAILDGHVKDLDKVGVAGMQVLIDGLGSVSGEDYYATTARDGYYEATLKPGSYRVCMREIVKGGKLGRDICSLATVFEPGRKAVLVRAAKTATVNFTLLRSAKTELTLDPPSVPANGLSGSHLKVRTTDRFGTPLAGQSVVVSPNVQGSRDQSLAVPALVCDSTGSRWPKAYPGTVDDSTDPYTVTTDSSGTYEATIAAGTVPGTWSISARNDTIPTARGYASANLAITAQPSVPLATLHTLVNDNAGGAVPQLSQFGGPGSNENLRNWLVALRQQPFWTGVEVIPVRGIDNRVAMLLVQGGTVSVNQTTAAITGDLSGARVLEPEDSGLAVTAQQQVAMGGQVSTLPVNWTAADWSAGTAPGTGLAPRGATYFDRYVTLGGLRFGGFPYPAGVAKSACG